MGLRRKIAASSRSVGYVTKADSTGARMVLQPRRHTLTARWQASLARSFPTVRAYGTRRTAETKIHVDPPEPVPSDPDESTAKACLAS